MGRNCYILLDDPKTSQLINPKESKNMMQRSKAKLMIKEACIISIFFPQIIKSYIRSMSVGNSYERYSQPLNINIPEVCTAFVH